MRELLFKYNHMARSETELRDSLESKIKERKAQIGRLQARLDRVPRTDWVEGFVEPLAAALSETVGLPWEIYGPFGLTCETTIYLREDMSRSICDQATLSITLEPHSGSDELEVVYRTGETTDEYQPGSVGWRNGMNCVTARLPDTLEEIVALLRSSGLDKKGAQPA